MYSQNALKLLEIKIQNKPDFAPNLKYFVVGAETLRKVQNCSNNNNSLSQIVISLTKMHPTPQNYI